MRIKKNISSFLATAILFCILPLLAGCNEDREPMAYPPTLVTSTPTTLTRFEAVLTGTAVKNPASLMDCKIGFLLSASASLSDAQTLEANPVEEGNNQYTTPVSGLQWGTKYYYCIYADAGNSRVKGSVQEFTTLSSVAPELGVTTAENPTESTVRLSCKEGIKDDGGQNITARGFAFRIFVEGENEPPTIYNKKVALTAIEEEFTYEVTGLQPNTRYAARAYATNKIGTGYSEEVVYFTTATEKKPALICNEATELTAFTANLTASITNDYGFKVTERGFCYSNESNAPTTENLKETIEEAENAFSTTLSSLNENTTYYVRAYAISEKGTGYSMPIEFVTKQVQRVNIENAPTIANITYTGATATAILSTPDGTEVTEKGICYSKLSTRPGTDSDHIVSTADGNTISATLALEEGTRYYVTAYATTQDGTYYSPATQFNTTQTKVPTLTLPVISSIDETFATAMATISNDGDAEITEKGICWSDALNAPTVGNNKLVDTNGEATIHLKMTELKAGTAYYVRAYAHNKNGYAYSATKEFTTKQTYKPTVEAVSFNAIHETTAEATAKVSSDGGSAILEQGFCYSTTIPTPTIDNHIAKGTLAGTTLTATLTGLDKGATYHVRAYVRNKNGISYSATRDLTTIENTIPTVAAIRAKEINDDNVTLQATIASNGGLSITEKGFIYSRENASPTLDDDPNSIRILKSDDPADIFTANTSKIEKLPYTTFYYVRAYAKNSMGVAYSSPTNFTTIASYTPSLNTPQVVSGSTITAHEAEVSGSIANNGGAEIVETGFWYSDQSSSAPNATNGKLVKSQQATGSIFSARLTGLGTYTYYYVRAYAKNKNGIAFSSSYITFTTLQSTPDQGDNPLPQPQSANKTQTTTK